MVLVVFPALIPDIRRVYDVYFAAFKGEPMAELMLDVLFPGGITEPFREVHTANTLKFWHESKNQYTAKCVDTETGEIVGMLLGDLHLHNTSSEERKNPGIPWLEGAEKERAEKILNPLWEVREKLWGGRRHIYCHVMGVDPAYQGRGAGKALVQWGIDLSEQANLPLYFEASPTTARFYEMMGFSRLKEKLVHKGELLGKDEDIEVPLMAKMPSIAGGMTFEEWRAQGYPQWKK